MWIGNNRPRNTNVLHIFAYYDNKPNQGAVLDINMKIAVAILVSKVIGNT